ncbi:leukocyte antigen CD37 [Trichomycterus rosablanca]|uniref:leukocyte antigen CD37 n=1 Tax=Trichomycterus rosablanca TaxID=2290929 RepID=UPI002F359BE2
MKILGISLFGCSVWILFDKNNIITVLSNEADVKVLAGGLFVVGLVVVAVFMLGCCGVYLENRCFLAFYMGLLIATVLGQLFITFLLLFKRNHIERVLTEYTDNTIRTYGVNTTESTWRLLDSMQQSAKCCGRQAASDWKTNTLIQVHNISDIYPCSCFNGTCHIFLANEMYKFGNGSHIYTMGCGDKLMDWLEKNIIGIVGMDIGLLVIQIVQFALAIHIFRNVGFKIKEQDSNNLLNANEENVPDSDVHPENMEDYQPDIYSHDHPNPDYTDQNFYQGHQPYREPNNAVYNQGHVNMYGQEDGDQYPPHQQLRRDPEQNSYIYNQMSDHSYGQEYVTQHHQDQHYLHEHDRDYRQPYSDHYNQGYVQD